MRKYKIALLFLSVVLMLSGCLSIDEESFNTSQPSAAKQEHLSKIFSLSDWLDFVDAKDADNILYMENSYLGNLRASEKSYYFDGVMLVTKDGKSVSGTIDAKRLSRKWSVEEQDKVLRTVLKFEDEFAQHGCKFDESISMIKILGHSRLPDVFAINSGIVINEDMLKMNEDELEGELIKAFFSYYLYHNPNAKNALCENLGYKALQNISIPDEFKNHIIIRPELYQPYVINATRTDIEEDIQRQWVAMSFIVPSTKAVQDYMVCVDLKEDKAVISPKKNTNIYIPELGFMKNYLAVSADVLKIEQFKFKDYDKYRVHAQDILCESFKELILKGVDSDDEVINIIISVLG